MCFRGGGGGGDQKCRTDFEKPVIRPEFHRLKQSGDNLQENFIDKILNELCVCVCVCVCKQPFHILYVLTSVWVLSTLNTGKNLIFCMFRQDVDGKRQKIRQK